MKKRWIFVLALVGVLTMTAACGGKETAEDSAQSTENTKTEEDTGMDFPNSSVTKLGNYKGVEIETISTEVTDKELQEQIDSLLAAHPDTKILDKTVVESGDLVNIDYTGYLNEEAFEGGSSNGQGYNLLIGSGSFIPGFEDGLIGKEVGSTCELPLTFPEEYKNNPDLAGQDVVFEVTVNAIVENVDAEWNDEFVQTYTEYDSVEAYMEGTLSSLQASKEENASAEKEYRVVEAIIETSEFDCSEEELESLKDSSRQQYEMYAAYSGLELEDFVASYMGVSLEEFELQLTSLAEFQMRSKLVIDAVAKAEGIVLTEEEYQEGLSSLAGEYAAESPETFEEQYGRSVIEENLVYDKTLDFLVENAVEIQGGAD